MFLIITIALIFVACYAIYTAEILKKEKNSKE